MARKKNTIPSGFEDILGNIYSNAEQGEGITDMDGIESSVQLVEDDTTEEPPVKTEDGNKTDDAATVEDDSQIPEDVLNGTTVDNQVEQQTEDVVE